MSWSLWRNIGPRPDALRARDSYRELAAGYDATCTRIASLRALAVRMLALSPGETVLDIACGTGAALPLLADAVGPSGRVIGVELSPEMAALARQRVAAMQGSAVVTVVQREIENFEPDRPADAVLLCYAHDVLQSPQALQRLVAAARPGARIATLGMKTLPWLWGWPVNAFNLYRARRYLTTYANLDRPWRGLAEQGAILRQAHSALWGSAYIAVGRMPLIENPPVTPGTE